MNKIIAFSNIKGGVGKTVLCAMFASFLRDRGCQVSVFDADIQASLYRHRDREVKTAPEVELPYMVSLLDTADGDKLQGVLKAVRQQDGIVLVDCPGNMNDNNLTHIFKAADAIVIPMSYDADTVDATGIFVRVLKAKTDAELIFIPNRINTTEGKAKEKQQREQTTKILGGIGMVTPRIKQSVVIKRYSTIYPLDRFQTLAVEHPFENIIEKLNL